jgi:uncharacterized protein DUF6084
VPALTFAVIGGAAEANAAVPTLRFTMAIDESAGMAVQSVMLTAQLYIALNRRGYERVEQERLADVFGAPERWPETARRLYWTRATLVVPPFERHATAELMVPCTYDFDVVSAKYFHALERGEIPLEFLFSGSVFFTTHQGALATVRLGWESEAPYRLPVCVWKDMMDQYFPDSAWLRLRRDAFDRLHAYKVAHALTGWDHAVDALLASADPGLPNGGTG